MQISTKEKGFKKSEMTIKILLRAKKAISKI